MENISPWWPVLTSLISSWLAYRIGYRVASTHAKNLELNVRKATPHLGSRVELRPYHPPDADWVKRYAIHTTLYNNGDLVATKIEGQWKLKISHLMENATKTIRIDSLSSSKPWDMEHVIGGTTNWFTSGFWALYVARRPLPEGKQLAERDVLLRVL